MLKTKVCGINKQTFWIAEFDDNSVTTVMHGPAYDENGNLSETVEQYRKANGLESSKIYNGIPVEVIAEIVSEDMIGRTMNAEGKTTVSELYPES